MILKIYSRTYGIKKILIDKEDDYFKILFGFKIADVQTIRRWNKDMKESVNIRLNNCFGGLIDGKL